MPKSTKNLSDGKGLCLKFGLQKIWAKGPLKFFSLKFLGIKVGLIRSKISGRCRAQIIMCVKTYFRDTDNLVRDNHK